MMVKIGKQCELKRVKCGDVSTSLALFGSMKIKIEDKEFFYKYTVNEQWHFQDFFWWDGASTTEYGLFGDVLVFDSAYKTNT